MTRPMLGKMIGRVRRRQRQELKVHASTAATALARKFAPPPGARRAKRLVGALADGRRRRGAPLRPGSEQQPYDRLQQLPPLAQGGEIELGHYRGHRSNQGRGESRQRTKRMAERSPGPL